MLVRALVVMIAFASACTIRSATFRGEGDDAGSDAGDGPPLAPCNVGHTGRLTGTVFAPNGSLPLAGVTVYVAGVNPGALPAGPSCVHCGAPLPGDPLTVTRTDAAGRFSLDGVPIAPSPNARLVVQTGKWRRQVLVPAVAECGVADVDPTVTRLPRNRSEGDLPHIAMSTSSDTLECVLPYLGVDPAEVTSGGGGAFHLFAEPGVATSQMSGGAALPPLADLTANAGLLGNYDLVMIGCDSVLTAMHTAAEAQTLVDYAAAGGRLFLGHYQGHWIAAAPSWQRIATFSFTAATSPPPQGRLTIDIATPRGAALAGWLQAIGKAAGTAFDVPSPRVACTAVDGSMAVPLIRLDHARNAPPLTTDGVQLFEFTTPVGTAGCGRVMFSDIHTNPDPTNQLPYPTECPAAATAGFLSAAYALFELGSCT